MNSKKILTAVLAVMTVLTLAACGNQAQKVSSSKTVSSSSKSKTATSKKKASKTSEKTAESSTSVKKSVSKVTSMNFDQIRQGNYSSLQGTWTETANSASGQVVKSGGSDTLNVDNTIITNGTTSIQKQTLTDTAGDHALVFNTKDNVLTANLKDEDVAINWMVKFYPKGTTSKYTTKGDSGKNSQNMIVVWTSNNSYTEIFAQTSTKKTIAKTTAAETGLNLSQIAKNNFSSLVGTWKNKTDGKTIVITGKTMNKPADTNVAWNKGAVVGGQDSNGYPKVVTSGKITSGYIQGGIGTFDPDAVGSTFDPLTIIPKNVKLSDSDDSDSTRDRLILGGGQGGTGTQAYYKE